MAEEVCCASQCQDLCKVFSCLNWIPPIILYIQYISVYTGAPTVWEPVLHYMGVFADPIFYMLYTVRHTLFSTPSYYCTGTNLENVPLHAIRVNSLGFAYSSLLKVYFHSYFEYCCLNRNIVEYSQRNPTREVVFLT